MGRTRKCRRVCRLPQTSEFVPVNGGGGDCVTLTVDEYEVLRLIDREGFSQEECGAKMKVARTTVQLIYAGARKKLADMLVEGLPLRIDGGSYALCDGKETSCSCGGCRKHSRDITDHTEGSKGRENGFMKIAVPFKCGQVFEQFGNAERFKIYETADGAITREIMADTDGKKHASLAGFLQENGVDVLICDGVGPAALAALGETEIGLYTGVSGNVHEAVKAFLAGGLSYAPETKCIDYDEREEEPDESANWRRGCH